MGKSQETFAGGEAQTQRRSTPFTRSSGINSIVCDTHRNGLRNVASGIRLRKRHDMLEKTERLANSWCVAKGLERTIGRIGFGGSNRLVQGGGRQ